MITKVIFYGSLFHTLDYVRFYGRKAVLLAPCKRKASLLDEASLLELLLDPFRILVIFCQLKPLFQLLLLLLHEEVIGELYVFVDGAVALQVREVEEVVSELLVLEVRYLRLSCSPSD